MNVDYTLVVEPQELTAYSGVSPQIIPTPFSNMGQGSIPVRNFVWDMAIKGGYKRHWVLDDNIEGFHRLNNNLKPKVISDVSFRCCEDFVDRYENIGLAGMNYYSFCKNTDRLPPFNINTRIYSCILIDNALPFRWRGIFNEDTDLSLRVLKHGLCTILFNAFLIGKVTTQRMGGGNTNELYATTDDRREFAESLKQQHPDIVRVVRKFGRWHHQVDYQSFYSNILKRKVIKPKQGSDYNMRLKPLVRCL
jgi:hypothetical protein